MAFIGASPSSLNSTTGVFISDMLKSDTRDYVTGSVVSNVAGSLFIQQSPDGVNWDVQNYTYSKLVSPTGNNTAIPVGTGTTEGTGAAFSEQLLLPYWRVKFTPTTPNTVATTFRLHARTSNAGVKY